jgi:mono/diheme cytochrome c family protein
VLKTTLIVLNIVVGVGLLGVLVGASIAKSRRTATPANLAPHYADDVLENQHLSRVLGWALLMVAIVAVALPAYWLLIPEIQSRHTAAFGERAVAQGAAAFQSVTKDPLALGCADCHGTNGEGGTAAYVYTDPDTGTKYRLAWKAPALDTVMLRFPREQVRTIITYGRRNTPMPAWGIEGGGAVNVQGVDDLLAFIDSIQITAEEAQARVLEELDAARTANPDASDGQLLFEMNCARCHTQGWSFADSYASPPKPNGTGGTGEPLPMIPGGGAYGPALLDGRVVRQFPTVDDHVKFIESGSVFQQAYGVRGVGSGGMPGYGEVLTDEQIAAIVEYERTLTSPVDSEAAADNTSETSE